MLTFSFEALQAIAHCCSCSEGRTEVGGLLAGRGDEVKVALALENVAEDLRRSFAFDHEALALELRSLDRDGLEMLGTFHTHPGGRAVMSGADVALAQASGLLLLIGLPAEGELHRPWEWRTYDPAGARETAFAIRPPRSSPPL